MDVPLTGGPGDGRTIPAGRPTEWVAWTLDPTGRHAIPILDDHGRPLTLPKDDPWGSAGIILSALAHLACYRRVGDRYLYRRPGTGT